MKIGSIPTLIGNHRILLDKVGSTQDFATKLLKNQSDLHGTVILAHSQENGKGRLAKKWESNEGENFIGSIIIQAPRVLNHENYGLISMLSAVAVQESIANMIDHEIKIKWPNDILISRKKVAGILIYNQWRAENLAHSIIGIGVNLNQTGFPDYLSQASSLKLIGRQHLDKTLYTEFLIGSLNKWYVVLQEGEIDQLLNAYHSLLFGMNEQLSFELNGSEYFGQILKVSANGKINIGSSLGDDEWYDIDQIKINY